MKLTNVNAGRSSAGRAASHCSMLDATCAPPLSLPPNPSRSSRRCIDWNVRATSPSRHASSVQSKAARETERIGDHAFAVNEARVVAGGGEALGDGRRRRVEELVLVVRAVGRHEAAREERRVRWRQRPGRRRHRVQEEDAIACERVEDAGSSAGAHIRTHRDGRRAPCRARRGRRRARPAARGVDAGNRGRHDPASRRDFGREDAGRDEEHADRRGQPGHAPPNPCAGREEREPAQRNEAARRCVPRVLQAPRTPGSRSHDRHRDPVPAAAAAPAALIVATPTTTARPEQDRRAARHHPGAASACRTTGPARRSSTSTAVIATPYASPRSSRARAPYPSG